MRSKTRQLRDAVLAILDAQTPAYSLRPEVLEMTALLADSHDSRPPAREHIAAGETRTPSGLALSPTMAAMCADDYVRTIKFIRGTHAAIVDVRNRVTDRPARVLYVGCGPYATLAVPLMAVFSPEEAVFELLDVHAESVNSAASIVDTLGLAGSLVRCQAVDAGAYRVSQQRPPDIILMEIMRACLEAEPQVAVARHLLRQTPNAILVPEEVSIDLRLVDTSREFDLSGGSEDSTPVERDRVPVATVFALNREQVRSWASHTGKQLRAATVRMPDQIKPQYQPMLFTTIRVYRDHVLQDYESGLTCPRGLLLEGEGAITAGATVHFHYQLGSHPRLHGEVCAERP